jgi:hypothetical protein
VVNFYGKLITARSEQPAPTDGTPPFPSVYVYSTFFYDKIMDGDYVPRWTARVRAAYARPVFLLARLTPRRGGVWGAYTRPVWMCLPRTYCSCLCTWACTGAWRWWTGGSGGSPITTRWAERTRCFSRYMPS